MDRMAPVRLNRRSLDELPKTVVKPQDEILDRAIGIVHFGVGSFHRRHQARYTQLVMEQIGGDWGILGVGLLPIDAGIRDAMREQDNLYALIEKGPNQSDVTVIGSIRDYVLPCLSPDASKRALDQLAAEETKIVTLTVTEKGYLRAGSSDELLWDHPMVVQDLKTPMVPASAIGFIVAGLELRRASGRRPFTVLSCDNVPENGVFVRQSVLALAQRSFGGELVEYIETECLFPSTMVDGITPQTYQADRDWIRDTVGVDDRAPVVAEKFLDWIIQDSFVDGVRPAWDQVGAKMVSDVVPFELAKIRLLNVVHSASTYAGYLVGLTYIHEAVTDPLIGEYASALMKDDIAPSLAHVAGLENFDVAAYGDVILDRFSNPSVKDTLERVAQDGSSKYANQLIPIVVENQQHGTNTTMLAIAVATWARHLHGDDEDGKELLVSDGRRDELMELIRRPDGIDQLVKDPAIFGGLDPASGPAFLDQVVRVYRSMCADGVRQTLRVALDALRAP